MNLDHQLFVNMLTQAVWLELDLQKVMEVIQNNYLPSKEEDVYSAVIAWIKRDLENRTPFIKILMNEVRFVSLPVEFLELIVEKEPLIVGEPSLLELRETAAQYRRSEAPARAQLRESLWQDRKYLRPRMPYVKTQRMYAFGGKPTAVATISIKNVESFDFQSGSWSEVTETPPTRWNPGIAEYEGKIWVAGGFDRSAPQGQRVLDTVKLYDPKSNEWSDGPKMNRRNHGFCLVVFGGMLHALGGKRTNTALKTTEVYARLTNTWTVYGRMKHQRYLFNAATLRSRLYVIGGEETSVNPQMEFYSLENRQWTLLPETIPGRRNFDVAVLDELLYVIGGDAHNTFNVFNPATDRWTVIPRPQDKVLAQIAVVAYDRFLYMVGGAGESGVTSFFWRYDPEKDKWFPMPNCIHARCGAKLFMIDP